MTKIRITPLFAIVAALLTACATTGDKGAESALPFEGKADSFRNPTEHGDVTFGVESSGELGRGEDFHAFDFALTGPAEVKITTSDLESSDLDTVIYLYRQGEQGWGRYIARNDDHGGSLLSRIDAELDAGRYRVIVKAYGSWDVGGFGLAVDCAGDGCASEAFDLAAAFAEAANGEALLISESDYEPQFVTGAGDPTANLGVDLVREVFGATLLAYADAEGSLDGDATFDDLVLARCTGFADSPCVADLLDDVVDGYLEDPDDDFYATSGRAFSRIRDLFDAHLTERTTFKLGPRDDDGSFAEDSGFYVYLVVGRTADGALAGFMVGTVET